MSVMFRNVGTYPVRMDFEGALSVGGLDVAFGCLQSQLQEFIWIDLVFRGHGGVAWCVLEMRRVYMRVPQVGCRTVDCERSGQAVEIRRSHSCDCRARHRVLRSCPPRRFQNYLLLLPVPTIPKHDVPHRI